MAFASEILWLKKDTNSGVFFFPPSYFDGDILKLNIRLTILQCWYFDFLSGPLRGSVFYWEQDESKCDSITLSERWAAYGVFRIHRKLALEIQ